MTDSPKTALEMQIEAEARELANVPKIPIHKFMNPGTFGRCHICGRVVSMEELKPYEAKRKACGLCHPNRGQNAARPVGRV